MDTKQKKIIWIAGIAVAVYYLAPTFINTARQQTMIRQQQAAIVAKAQAARAAQQAAPPPAPPVSPAVQQASSLLGVWQGMGLVDGMGNCNMRLELRSAPEPGQITGYPVMVCVQIPIISSGPKTLAQFTPSSAVLTGTKNATGFDFTVDKVTSKGAGLCSFTSFTVTPFGTDQISVEWKEDPCGSGQTLLKRIGR